MQNEQNTVANVPVLTLDSDAVLETAKSKADVKSVEGSTRHNKK